MKTHGNNVRGVVKLAARVALGCVALTMLVPPTAFAADRMVLMEEFTGTW